MKNNNRLLSNIYKDYIFTFVSNFDLTRGFWMLYLASKGLSLFEIGLMETIYHISSFSMEIPTGMVADIYGRKTSRILGRVCFSFAILLMILGENVLSFAFSFFFTALGNNLESGAGEALIYDSLKELCKENIYMKIRGNNEFVFQVTSMVALLLGGYIATLSYGFVYKITFILALLSVVSSFSFVEPSIGKPDRSKRVVDTFVLQIKKSFLVVKNDKKLLKIIILLELFSTFYATEFFYLQNKLKGIGKTEFEIGIVLGIGAVIAALSASQTYRLERRFNLKNMLTMMSLVAIVAFWGMSINGIEIYSFIILSLVDSLLFVSMGDYINKLIPSEQRATILSLQSMVFSAFMIVIFPLSGKIGDLFGLSFAFKMIAIISSLVLLVVIYMIRKTDLE
ncbi:MFS transporter [Helicovermis profundi]|uniref:MFS transporter n=1 Tax=Helicovermis profundi TaxID=3065157 RepID=A0AAU9EWU1_9FIRM|nr:MFS transporter [Clostridia bacterium S502]